MPQIFWYVRGIFFREQARGSINIYFRKLSLNDIADMLEDEDTPAIDYITIEPPDAGLLTDEDEADEDTGGLVSDLTGNQLRAPAIAVTVDGDILETHSDTRSKRKCTARGAGVKRKSSALHSPGQSGDGNKGKKL